MTKYYKFPIALFVSVNLDNRLIRLMVSYHNCISKNAFHE